MQSITGQVLSVTEQISRLREICPHSIALSCGDRHLSYAELNHQADQFAGYLAQRGVASGDTVAICMERSFDWIVAALGIMRARAAYLPLDPAWPDSRLRFAVNDSRATALVARTETIDRLNVKAEGIDPRRDALAIATADKDAAANDPAPLESLAYVIYTSGSTGVPKGVEITHANLCQLIHWHQDAFHLRPQDRASHLAGLGFDAAVWEIWPHLAAGATVCLADDAARLSPKLLQLWLIRDRITIAFAPTVHATALMAMSWPDTTSLRLLLTGGDVLHHGPTLNLPFSVVNNYGPTECTVVSTSALLTPGAPGAPTIGRPITGASIYVLDEERRPVPDGSRGEIYIGGGGVGRGYRNLPGASERCFLPDPFAATPVARMYRTGDFGVRRPSGEIEFCGRRDRQTKIRGIRIELDEIGGALMSHPAVDFAVAVTRTSAEGANELVAYVLPQKDATAPTVREVQQHLLERLPDYMVPATFVRLHELPLSANAKLDFKNLAPPTEQNLLQRDATRPASVDADLVVKNFGNSEVPGASRQHRLEQDANRPLPHCQAHGFAESSRAGNRKSDDWMHTSCCAQTAATVIEAAGCTPWCPIPALSHASSGKASVLGMKNTRAPVEEKLLVMMREILKNNGIRAEDNFFLFGGHSLLAMQLVMRVRDTFGVDMTLRQFFESPTVERLAVLVETILIENISSMTDEEAEKQLTE
jgi:amino acid adenylation domain-containing protein